MNVFMHPDEMVEIVRMHHGDILRLVEIERMLEPIPRKSPGLLERLLLGMSDLLTAVRSKPRPKEVEVVCRSTCDETGAWVV